MPTIKQYNVSPEEVAQGFNTTPLERAVEHGTSTARFIEYNARIRGQAFSQLGRDAQEVYNQVKQYNDSQAELSFTTDLINLEMNQQKAQDAYFKDPGNLSPDKVDAFRAQQNEERQQVLGKYAGYDPKLQETFAREMGNYSLRNFEKQTVELSEITAANSVTTLTSIDRKAADMAAQAAQKGDLTATEASLNYLDSSYGAVTKNPYLSPVEAARIQEHKLAQQKEIVMGAGSQLIEADHTEDKLVAQQHIKAAMGPGTRFYETIGQEGFNTLMDRARQQAALQSTTNRSQDEENRRVAETRVSDAVNRLALDPPRNADGTMNMNAFNRQLGDIIGMGHYNDTKGNLLSVDSTGLVKSMIDYRDAKAKGIQGDIMEGTFRGAVQGMAQGVMPTQAQIYEWRAQGKLNDQGMDILNRLIKPDNAMQRDLQLRDLTSVSQMAQASLIADVVGPTSQISNIEQLNAGQALQVRQGLQAYNNWLYASYFTELARGIPSDQLLDPRSPTSLTNPERIKSFLQPITPRAVNPPGAPAQPASARPPLTIQLNLPPRAAQPAPAAPAPASKPVTNPNEVVVPGEQ